MNFFDIPDFKSARKVLIIPNITNLKNLEKDSFVDVIYNHISSLNKRGNYYFHLILPKPLGRLNFPNVEQHIVDISGNILAMRVLFPKEIINLLKTLDYDVVYSHMPDWFQVARFTQKEIIGYSHWFEMRSCNAEDRLANFRNLVVSLYQVTRMKVCYLNTQEQKDKIIEEAKEWFSDDVLNVLRQKLVVWNLGVDKNKIIETPLDKKENIIVFNHRCIANKGFPKFMELMKEYRERRQDFKVWLPQLNEVAEEPWIDTIKCVKEEYYKKLQICKVGVQMRQTHYGWSVAATDCMMNGTPVIFQESDCYKEIDDNGIFWKYKKDFFNLLDCMLNDDTYRREHELRSIERAKVLSTNDDKMIDELHLQLNQ